MIDTLHVLAIPMAAFRLTELIAQDQITLPIRKRLPGYIWTCHRCISVWAGAAVALFFVLWPWLNWPLALSWLYLCQQDNRAFRRQLHKRSFVVVVGDNKSLDITRQELTPEELDAIAEILPRVHSQVS